MFALGQGLNPRALATAIVVQVLLTVASLVAEERLTRCDSASVANVLQTTTIEDHHRIHIRTRTLEVAVEAAPTPPAGPGEARAARLFTRSLDRQGAASPPSAPEDSSVQDWWRR